MTTLQLRRNVHLVAFVYCRRPFEDEVTRKLKHTGAGVRIRDSFLFFLSVFLFFLLLCVCVFVCVCVCVCVCVDFLRSLQRHYT